MINKAFALKQGVWGLTFWGVWGLTCDNGSIGIYFRRASAILMSNGVVILMFSRLPSTIAT